MDGLISWAANQGPIAVLVVGGMLWLKSDIKDIKEHITKCVARREAVEEALHGRCTQNATEVARLSGRMNGQAAKKE